MRYRIFIAINVPEKIKEKFVFYQEEIEASLKSDYSQDSGTGLFRWTKRKNMHITLMFLGYVLDEELLNILKIGREVVLRNQPFSVNLKKICYAPPKKMPPKMIWLQGEESKNLSLLQNSLEKELLEKFTLEKRPYLPHITLARIKAWQWRKLEPEERPEINQEIDLQFKVNSIEVMESKLKRGGPEYTILESMPLLNSNN